VRSEVSVRPGDLDSVLVRGLDRRRLIGLDVAIAAGWTLVLGAGTVARSRPDPPSAGALALVALVGLPAGLRRVAPLPVLAVVTAATVTGLVTATVTDPFAAVAFVGYVVAQRPRRRPVVPVRVLAAVTGVLGVLAVTAGTPGPVPGRAVPVAQGAVLVTVAVALGRVVQLRRHDAARAAHEQATRAVLAERLRIAREMHDVVTHGLGLIAVQAGVANHVADRRPDQARAALAVIETTSREALAEMRRMLGVLREPGPAPGLAAVPALVDRARTAGVDAALDVDPAAGEDLPEAIGLAVYRVVQEALTNVTRHAPGARCRVVVRRPPGLVTVTVTDDGPAPPPVGQPVGAGPDGAGADGPAPGYGLAGLRERVAAHGGRLTARSRRDGGFEVHATLPAGVPGGEGR